MRVWAKIMNEKVRYTFIDDEHAGLTWNKSYNVVSYEDDGVVLVNDYNKEYKVEFDMVKPESQL